jgi:DNA-binding transcriptional LysR family regulator
MVTGTVGGAARLLNVSSPGVSRVMKHAETSVGVKLFSRKGGRYSPTPQANAIFSQINGVYDKIEDLQFVISRIQRGAETELKIGSVPSIANIMVPRAIADLRKALPNLLIEVDILKIEDAADYLLLGKGELVALSYKLDHAMLAIEPLARGRLKCIVPEGHPLARRARVTTDEIVKYPLIGVDPNDPYGKIMEGLFASHALHCHRGRVHLGRRPVATVAGARHCRADRVSDLYRTPQGCAAFEPRRAICDRIARSNGNRGAIATAAQKITSC